MSEPAGIPTAAHLVALRSAREAELLLQFCDGKVLGAEEMAEVAHILPPEVLANPPAPELVRAPEAYAAEIGTSKRTVFRWLELGRKNKDHCPVDDPAQMLGWWARNMTHKVPDYVSEWVARAKTIPRAQVATNSRTAHARVGAGALPDPKGAQPDRLAIDINKLGGQGLESSVLILKQIVEANGQLLASAFNDPNDSSLAHYQSRYEKSVEMLRKADQSLLALQKARGDLAPRGEYRNDLVNLLVGLRGMLRRRADNVCAKLSTSLSPEQLGLVRAALVAEAARDEKLLRTSRFWIEEPSGEIQLPAA